MPFIIIMHKRGCIQTSCPRVVVTLSFRNVAFSRAEKDFIYKIITKINSTNWDIQFAMCDSFACEKPANFL